MRICCWIAAFLLSLPMLAAQSRAELESRLRQTGQHLELSASYHSDLRIDSLPEKTESSFGDCGFYEDFIRLLDIEKSTAVEGKIRKLSLEEASRFIYLYGQKLKSQNKWTDSLGEKMNDYRRAISERNCSPEEDSENEQAEKLD